MARNLFEMSVLATPVVTVVTGEGGSGGALAIGVCDRLMMLQYSTYSVISPEGCASILWRRADKAQDAAAALRITAQDLTSLGIVDGIIPEPMGGAHRAPDEAMGAVGEQIARALAELSHLSPDEVRRQRREKFLAIGRDLGK